MVASLVNFSTKLGLRHESWPVRTDLAATGRPTLRRLTPADAARVRSATLPFVKGSALKFIFLPVSAALALALALPAAMAQTGVSSPAAVASAPRAAKPSPRPLTPAELRDSGSSEANDRPVGAVTPQISIPLGKKPAPPSMPYSRAARPDAGAASGGINDSAARCEAQASEQARAACREKLTRARKP